MIPGEKCDRMMYIEMYVGNKASAFWGGEGSMGVSRKGRRTLQYKGAEFIWWVVPNEDDRDKVYLNIVSEDKSIVLSYNVGDGGCFVVISKGRFFQGHKTSENWEVYRIPFKLPLLIVTPRDVEQFVEWAVDGRGAVPIGAK